MDGVTISALVGLENIGIFMLIWYKIGKLEGKICQISERLNNLEEKI